MFPLRADANTLRRLAEIDDELHVSERYYLEEANTRRRVAGGRAFPSIMTAFLALGSQVPAAGGVLHIVDAAGKAVYAPPACAEEVDTRHRRPRYLV